MYSIYVRQRCALRSSFYGSQRINVVLSASWPIDRYLRLDLRHTPLAITQWQRRKPITPTSLFPLHWPCSRVWSLFYRHGRQGISTCYLTWHKVGLPRFQSWYSCTFRLSNECRRPSVFLLCFNVWHRTSTLPWRPSAYQYIGGWIIITIIIIIIIVITRAPLNWYSAAPWIQHTVNKNKINKNGS